MKAPHVLETLSPRFGKIQSGNNALASVAMAQSLRFPEDKDIFNSTRSYSWIFAGLAT